MITGTVTGDRELVIHLEALAADLLMAQRVRYDLGKMFDPAYTMVCKLAKNILPAAT